MGEAKYSTSGQIRAKHVKVVQTRITLQITNENHFCKYPIRSALECANDYIKTTDMALLLIELVESFAIAIHHPRRAYRLQVSIDSSLKNNLRTQLPFVIL